MDFGIDRILNEENLRKQLKGRRIALLAHPASVDKNLNHSLDLIFSCSDLNLTAAFGPQHGLKGDKQDNMIESEDYTDPVLGIPVFSLYGKVRRPTPEMMQHFDVLLIDLQDLGCRIYTFITTLRYMLEEAARFNKTVYILDRPNPAGRVVEGFLLKKGYESFVGAGEFPLRHGLTMGEMAFWYQKKQRLDLELELIPMTGWNPDKSPGYGWPEGRAWVNPSPNAANLNMARCYAGTVMLEGTNLSEGRGTTRSLEMAGAPDLDIDRILKKMYEFSPEWLKGCLIRKCFFEPTFHKHAQTLCQGLSIHTDFEKYDHDSFRPWRLMACFFKVLKLLCPGYDLWRDFAYEYETDKLAVDLINGTDFLRKWVDDEKATPEDLDKKALIDEKHWMEERQQFLIY